jgi:hypothetical protein
MAAHSSGETVLIRSKKKTRKYIYPNPHISYIKEAPLALAIKIKNWAENTYANKV